MPVRQKKNDKSVLEVKLLYNSCVVWPFRKRFSHHPNPILSSHHIHSWWYWSWRNKANITAFTISHKTSALFIQELVALRALETSRMPFQIGSHSQDVLVMNLTSATHARPHFEARTGGGRYRRATRCCCRTWNKSVNMWEEAWSQDGGVWYQCLMASFKHLPINGYEEHFYSGGGGQLDMGWPKISRRAY